MLQSINTGLDTRYALSRSLIGYSRKDLWHKIKQGEVVRVLREAQIKVLEKEGRQVITWDEYNMESMLTGPCSMVRIQMNLRNSCSPSRPLGWGVASGNLLLTQGCFYKVQMPGPHCRALKQKLSGRSPLLFCITPQMSSMLTTPGESSE